jgi:hypothetical protein
VSSTVSANASKLNSITIDDGARAEIQQALSQNLEVTVHENPISVNGWSGSGYAIIDSGMGVGAYKISGGASGGFALIAVAQLLIVASFLTIAVIAGTLSGAVLVGALFSGLAMDSFTNNINIAFDLQKSGKITTDELNGTIAGLSIFTIIGTLLGIKVNYLKKLGKRSEADFSLMDQLLITVTNKFFEIAALLPHR